jgi:hypothetical protein
MATQRYWGANYWGSTYWSSEYWAEVSGGEVIGQIAATTALEGPTTPTGAYFGSNYFGDEYWSSTYWGLGESGGGTTFTGSFVPKGIITGALSASTSNTADFVGSVGQVVLFDLEVGFTISWQFTETSTYTGSITNTLEAASASISGLFSEDFTGTIDATLGAVTPNFDGTHVAPANVAGTIGPTLQGYTANIDGFSVDVGSLGSIGVTLEDESSDFQGQYITSNTSGTISVALDDITPAWSGVSADADTVIGSFAESLASFTGSFSGSSEYDFNIIESESEPDTLREGTSVGSRKGRSRVTTRRKIRA